MKDRLVGHWWGAVCLLAAISCRGNEDAALLAWWPLATNTADEVSRVEAVLAEGAQLKAESLQLNGEGGFADLGAFPGLTNSFSISLWLKPQTDDRLLRVLGKFACGDKQFCTFLAMSNRVWVALSADGSMDPEHSILTTTREPAIPANTWSHLAVTWDATKAANGLSIYAAATPLPAADAQAGDVTALHESAENLTLGAYDLTEGVAATNTFQGSICQLSIWDGVLTPGEIKAIVEQGRNADLISWLVGREGEGAALGSVKNHGATETVTIVEGVSNAPALSGSNGVLRLPAVKHGRKLIYVNKHEGDDRLSGLLPTVFGKEGPKKTIASGLLATQPGGTMIVKSGNYGEHLNVSGRDIHVRIEGSVNLSGNGGPIQLTLPPPFGMATNLATSVASTNGVK